MKIPLRTGCLSYAVILLIIILPIDIMWVMTAFSFDQSSVTLPNLHLPPQPWIGIGNLASAIALTVGLIIWVTVDLDKLDFTFTSST
jgi:hypothetical protein